MIAITQYQQAIDYKLAFHCAPVIAGVKPANLITLKRTGAETTDNQIRWIKSALCTKGIYMFTLLEEPDRALILLYNRQQLWEWLNTPENKALLDKYKHTPSECPEMLLGQLKRRINESNGFPHEIGVFLGYPPGDVEDFIRNKGRHYSLSGYWKVYRNVEEAKKTFSVYDHVRSFFCQKVVDGENIYNIKYGGTAI